MATTASYVPGVSLADKLRLAASKGQLDKVKELVAGGASFEPDRVSFCNLQQFGKCVTIFTTELSKGPAIIIKISSST